MAYLALFALPFLLVGGLISCTIEGTELLVIWVSDRRARRIARIARIEAELDQKQMELRATILLLANQLGGDAEEARKALIREWFLASGKVPPTQL